MRFTSWRVFIFLFAASPWALGQSDPPPETNPDEQKLLSAGLSANGPGLVDFFRQRARVEADAEALLAWTRRLNDADPGVRASATRALLGRGPAALPILRHVINDLGDAELTNRARRCVQLIEGEGSTALPVAAARLLALRKPAGAVEALLGYLPTVEAPVVVEEVANTLAALAYPQGKPHPALLEALEDALPLRRAVAGAALCRKDQPEVWQAVHKLLRDTKPLVRLRVAMALTEADDPEAVSVLIDLFSEASTPQSRQAEDLLVSLAGDWAPNPAAGDDLISRRIRRDAWASWWRNTDSATLLAEFRGRTLNRTDQARVAALIEKLGDESFDVRQGAVAELTEFGLLAAPLLREAARGSDAERARLAEECLREIADKGGKPLPAAAARLLSLRKPDGALQTLLDYVPYAEDDAMSAEVQTALVSLARQGGRLDPALARTLNDTHPLRRLAAALALLQAGALEHRDAVRKLLRDGDPRVRLRTALALAARRDNVAVPVLIDSLAEETSETTGEVEDLLYRLAGDQAPKVEPASDPAGRRKVRDAWAAWWKKAAPQTDLIVLASPQRLLGYTLLTEASNAGRVMELGRDGKPRWTIANLAFPCDAHVLGENRVLIAEFQGKRVTERDFKGNILWQKEGLTGHPVNVQRLPNGNTFIACNIEMLEVDRAGKTVWSRSLANLDAAYKSRDGVVTCFTADGQCLRFSSAGKELKTFSSGRGNALIGGIDVTPQGRIVISQPAQGMVLEVNGEGRMLWQASAPGIATATRLPNGHILAASNSNNSVVELDRAGKIVWEHKETWPIYRARRR